MLDEQALIQDRVAQQTFLNNTAVNDDNFKNELSLIAGYPEGSIVLVTYYSRNSPLTDVRSDIVDILTPAKDDVHVDLTEIRNFELRISGDFNFEFLADVNRSKLSGEAITFAGFVPRIGDFFLYQLRNSKIGVFYITDIQRLAIGQDTYHKINFNLAMYLTPDGRDRLRHQTTSQLYFDKTKFLAGNHALLTSQGYIEQKDLRHIRKEIIQNYTDRFYTTDKSSFIRPDGLYDPYVVEYWNKKVDYLDSPVRPVQLFIAVQNYKKTIWAALTNNPIKNLRNLAYAWDKKQFQSTFWGVNITSLLRSDYIAVGDEKGSLLYPTINDYGLPELWDPLPFIHSDRWDASLRDKAKALQQNWIRVFAFFNPDNPGGTPEQTCTLYTSDPKKYFKEHKFPVDEKLCSKCPHKDTCPTRCHLLKLQPPKPHHHKPINPFKAPYPIHTKAELALIWKKLRHIPDRLELTEEQEIDLEKYISWYYTRYSGTLSKYELEHSWRVKHDIADGVELTEEQIIKIQEYVDWYRRSYPKVCSDVELEIMWRTYMGIGLSRPILEDEKIQLQIYIDKYRRFHGYMRIDDITNKDDSIPNPAYLFLDDLPALYYDDPRKFPHPGIDDSPPKPIRPNPPLHRSGPPYPILSNDELANVWRKMHDLEPDCPLTDNQLLQIKGYILWYRETYPGTLSALELEQEWREQNKLCCPVLSPDQSIALKEYIKSYRSKFLPVLADREIELLWRARFGIELNVELNPKQLCGLKKEIAKYRFHHGYVPKDRDVSDMAEIGSAYSAEEFELLGNTTGVKVTPDDAVSGTEGDMTEDVEEEEKEDLNLPTFYYPPIRGYHLCPNFCHILCNSPVDTSTSNKTTETKDEGPSYALSKEFYFGNPNMDPFEKLLYDTLTNKEVRPDKILEAVSCYLDWDDEEAFYRHLFSLYLIDRALYWLRYHS